MIIEQSGPPIFEFKWNDETKSDTECIRYRTLRAHCYDPNNLVREMNARIQKIKVAINNVNVDNILYWRQYPEMIRDEDTGLFYWCCRIATWPKLSDEFWKDLGHIVEQGEPSELIK